MIFGAMIWMKQGMLEEQKPLLPAKRALTTANPLLVVKPVATAALTAALSQHVEGVSTGQAVLLCGTPAGGTGLVAGCRKNPE